MLYILLLSIFVTYNRVYCAFPDGYYWREFTGTIPEDAIVGGQDANNNYLYIGQALSKDYALVVVPLIEGVTSAEAAFGSEVVKFDSNIKILCGNANNFQWLTSSGATLSTDLISNKPVIGGVQHEGLMYIGRAYSGNAIQIGHINSWVTDKTPLEFVLNHEVKTVFAYEILVNV